MSDLDNVESEEIPNTNAVYTLCPHTKHVYRYR